MLNPSMGQKLNLQPGPKCTEALPAVRTFVSRNPATLQTIAKFESSSPADVSQAVRRARNAFVSWSALSPRERRKCLRCVRAVLLARAGEMALLISQEIGKPLPEAWGAEILPVLDALSTLEKDADRWLSGRRVSMPWWRRSQGIREGRVSHEPLGVIGVIGTWNYPLMIDVLKVASALICGNTVVWKPSEYSTVVATAFRRVLSEAGLPRGVCEMVVGDGSVGELLTEARCDKLLFTGSVSTGRQILSRLAHTGTPAVLELSGLDACFICADAPVRLAAEGVVWGAFTNAGQTCIAPRRIYADRSVYHHFFKECLDITSRLRLGAGRDGLFDVGPLRDERLLVRLEDLIRDACAKGARIEAGGSRRKDLTGYFFEPTVLSGANGSMRVMKEDFFGPVIALQSVASEDEMVRFANESDYGLAASIWSRDEKRAERLASQLHCGVVWINGSVTSVGDIRVPFGGVKISGFGRLHGPEGLKELVNVKYVETRSASTRPRWYFPYESGTAGILEGLALMKHGRGLRQRWRGGLALWKAARKP